jgi:predicted outer membrane repeat protein
VVNNVALDLQNSIVSSNSATRSGGGILLDAFTIPATGGGILDAGHLTLGNSVVTGNNFPDDITR